jgi:hypothetical protein
VKVQVEYRRSAQVYAQVLNGEADFGLVAYPARRKGILVEPFHRGQDGHDLPSRPPPREEKKHRALRN